MVDTLLIRPATAADAADIARLANALDASDGPGTQPYSADVIRRDGFGPHPAFTVLLAELDGRAIGYALFMDIYNSDLAAPGVLLSDLFVEPEARGCGIGRALIAAVAREAVARGAKSVSWGVLERNAAARGFYARLGARDTPTALLLELDGPALDALAAEAQP